MWSCKTQIIGKPRMERSETTLTPAVATNVLVMLRQTPECNGFQIFALGTHWKISKNINIVKKMVLSQMRT